MIRNTKTYKQIILSLVITTTLVTFNISSALAKTLGGTYKSTVVVKNFNQLEDEIAEALKIGAVTAEINLDDKFLAEFHKNGGNLNDLITASGFKADDYHHNVISSYGRNGMAYDSKVATYNFEYLETTEETKAVEAEVQKILAKIITPNMKEEEKLKVIHDYIVTNVEYDSNGLQSGNSSHSAYAALFKDKGGDSKETVCQGYALLFYRMAIDAGLEARIMTGQAGEAHAWNLVKVNGNWYQIDLTWNDPVGIADKNYKRYDYYNLTDDQLKKDHLVFNNPEKYPRCTTNYADVETNEVILEEIGRLKTNDLKVTTEDEFKAKILEEIAKGKTKTTIKYEGLKDAKTGYGVIWKVKDEQRNVLNDLEARYSSEGNGINFFIDIKYKDSIASIKADNNSYNMTLAKPEEVKIIAKTKLGESKDITNNSVYVSSNTKVVTVDRNSGKLIPHSIGDAKIIVKYGGVQDEILVKVNNVAAKSTNSNLSKLTEDGTLLSGFSKDILSYNKQLPAGTTNIPVIKADKEDPKANIDIVQAKNLTGSEEERTAKINVTAEDGSVKRYKVVFSLKPEVKPVVDPVVKPVVDPAVKPVVDPVVKPVVDPVVKPPVKPEAKLKLGFQAYEYLNNQNKLQLQADANLKNQNKLKLRADSDLKNAANSEYKAVINATSKEGMAPELPSTITVLNSDGTYKKLEVKWNDIDSINYEKSGEFEIEGSIKDTGEKVKAVVVVISDEENLPKTGSLVNFNIINSLGLILIFLGTALVKRSKRRFN